MTWVIESVVRATLAFHSADMPGAAVPPWLVWATEAATATGSELAVATAVTETGASEATSAFGFLRVDGAGNASSGKRAVGAADAADATDAADAAGADAGAVEVDLSADLAAGKWFSVGFRSSTRAVADLEGETLTVDGCCSSRSVAIFFFNLAVKQEVSAGGEGKQKNKYWEQGARACKCLGLIIEPVERNTLCCGVTAERSSCEPPKIRNKNSKFLLRVHTW